MENFQLDQVRILAVDDEQSILHTYQQVLSSEQEEHQMTTETEELEEVDFGESITSPSIPLFDLVISQRGDEAVDIVKQSLEENCPFAVIFMDTQMPPGPNGIWAAEHIRALDPHVEIVIMTDNSDLVPKDLIYRVPPIHKLLCIQKPVSPEEIKQFAHALGSKWQTERERGKVQGELEKWIEERTVELMRTNEQLEEEIEERKRIEEALRKSEERYRIVLESSPDPVIVYDMQGKITYFNPAFSHVFGWSLHENIGQNIDFVPVENLPENRLIFEKIKHGETVSGIETYRLTRKNDRVEVSISGAGFFNGQGELQGSVITIQDITKRKKTEEEIKYIAYHDSLTGLPNRKSFYMRLEDKLLQSYGQSGGKRRVTRHRWALLFLDLDRFKYVNDTLGHDAGDELLKAVAIRLQRCLRKSDYIFRLGGDEFTIILNSLTQDTDVAKVAQKIRKEIARPCDIKGHDLYMTISIGISIYPGDGNNVETLVKNSDMAMYVAKEGNEGYRFFTEEMNRNALERMKIESSLRNALQDNQFIVYYQPLVNKHNKVIGMEALLRWHHPELGIVSPSRFIPLAEETGSIIPIGKWVLHSACRQAKQWHEMGHTNLYVAVNLSTRQFREPDLIETIEDAIERTNLPPNSLKLEVTESGIMENPEDAIVKMEILRAKGIHFSIDDFGTGYSSLSYLKRFPIDTLKIDRSFVIDSTTNKDDQEIIKTIIAMARNLSMNTVAEGVETQEQRDFLVHHGCHMMQGYYLGRPMPPDKFEEMLIKKNERFKKKR